MLACLAFSAIATLNFLVLHWDAVLMFLTFALYAVKQTKWGKSNAEALRFLAGVVERLDKTDVKKVVQLHSLGLPKAVADALDDAVRTVDPKKPSPAAAEVVVREATRGIRRKKASKE